MIKLHNFQRILRFGVHIYIHIIYTTQKKEDRSLKKIKPSHFQRT